MLISTEISFDPSYFRLWSHTESTHLLDLRLRVVIKVMGFANFSITSINYHVYIFPLITAQLSWVSAKVKFEGEEKLLWNVHKYAFLIM